MTSKAVCHRCGSADLESGDLIDPFNRGKVLFRPHAKRFFTLRPGIELTTSICMDCGCVQVHADVQAVAGMLKEDKSSPSDESNSAEPIECLDCGATIDAVDSKCSKCGWSYRS